tara:strand:- start:95 stop:766 length:672 start_codon:yes stop_codon:yes gene_type:complete
MEATLLHTGLYQLPVFRTYLGVLSQLARVFAVMVQEYMDQMAETQQVPFMIAFCRRRARWLGDGNMKVGRRLVHPTAFTFPAFDAHLSATSAVTTLNLACCDAYQKVIYQHFLYARDKARRPRAVEGAGASDASKARCAHDDSMMPNLRVLRHYVNGGGGALLTLKRLLSHRSCLRKLMRVDVVSCRAHVDVLLIDCLVTHALRRGVTVHFVVAVEQECDADA